MAEGTIKRKTDRGFGFIDTGDNKDMFFHMSNLEGIDWDDLQEGQKVTFEIGQSPKGPRAEQVRPGLFCAAERLYKIYDLKVRNYSDDHPETDLTSRKSSIPQTPPSRPFPDFFMPPKGEPEPRDWPFISTIPERSDRAKRLALTLSWV